MTNLQERTIERLKKEAFNDLALDKNNYEVKYVEVEEYDYFTSLVVEVGMIGDEGTMAQAFCRYRVHLFVGKRGGVTYPVYKNGKSYTKRLNNQSLFCVSYEQNH